ncbi:MAG: hypothetical protein ABIN94_09305 [Ferruginibacter sp.]
MWVRELLVKTHNNGGGFDMRSGFFFGNTYKAGETFLQAYLTALNISFRTFATAIETNDANLKKYLSGERKFNADLARKFGHFFHGSPVIWMKVNQLNDLLELQAEKVDNRYDRYDFMKHISTTAANYKIPPVKRNEVAEQETAYTAGKKAKTRK